MNFNEFELGLANGSLSMKDPYWIVDYRFFTSIGKVVRHIKPTKVLVFDKKITPTPVNIYYADHYFRKIGKSGLPNKQIIQTHGNGGISVFTSEEEAEKFYKQQCYEVLGEIEIARCLTIYDFSQLEIDAQQQLLNATRNTKN